MKAVALGRVMDFAVPPRAHVFVDESKAKGYYLAAAVISRDDVNSARGVLNGLRHRRSASVHFKGEKDAVRSAFLEGAAATGVQTVLYVVKGQPDKVARPALGALIDELCAVNAGRLVIERRIGGASGNLDWVGGGLQSPRRLDAGGRLPGTSDNYSLRFTVSRRDAVP